MFRYVCGTFLFVIQAGIQRPLYLLAGCLSGGYCEYIFYAFTGVTNAAPLDPRYKRGPVTTVSKNQYVRM
jgi:hypothetical protein